MAYSITGLSPGDVFTAALQAPGAITATGRYGYSVLVQVPGQADQHLNGSTFVVAQDASALGAGWTLAGVDRLVSVASDSNGPAGMLRVYGSCHLRRNGGAGEARNGCRNPSLPASG